MRLRDRSVVNLVVCELQYCLYVILDKLCVETIAKIVLPGETSLVYVGRGGRSDVYVGAAVYELHPLCLPLPVGLIILDGAQRVYPDIVDCKSGRNFKGICKRLGDILR